MRCSVDSDAALGWRTIVIRTSTLALVSAVLLGVTLGAVANAQPVSTSATGTWSIRYSGSPMSPAELVLHQQGQVVLGSYGNGFTLHGNINKDNPHQVDATWQDASGSGWATLIFDADWKTLSGRWGDPGKQPKGSFVASRVYNQINTTGKWNVTLTGMQVHTAVLMFNQTGSTFIGTWPNGHLTGVLPPGEIEVRGHWQTKKLSGPIDITFTSDGTKFEGTWGYPGKAPKGRIVGTKIQE